MAKASERHIPLSFTILISLGILLGCGEKKEEQTQVAAPVVQPTPIVPLTTEQQQTVTGAMSRAQDLSISPECLKHFDEREVRSSVDSSLASGRFQPIPLMTANVPGQRPRGMRGAYSEAHLKYLNQSILCVNELNRIATILNYFQAAYAPGAVSGYIGSVLNRGYSMIGNGVVTDPIGGF